jgi:signal transduction histidine kinase
MTKDSFLDRFIERVDSMDPTSLQAYILHLSREKGFLETIFNTIHEGILVINRRLKIQYHNRAAKEMLGLPDDLSRIRLSQFLRNIDWRRILQGDMDEWAKMSRQEIEVLYPERRIIQFYLVPHREDKGFATVILKDVTESRDRSQSELESEKIQAISMLAASVAHEIGNPLNSLYLHLQLLHRQFSAGDFDRDDALELLDVAKGEVERLDNIITQFLQAIRPGRPKLMPVDMKTLIIESLTFMRQEIEDRQVNVKCDWPNFLPEVPGDPGQLKQAFYNIIKNAIQAMPDGGSLDIKCSYNDEFVIVSFTDTGTGISRDKLGTVFDPYYTSRKEGSGLGMMIIERIIREHGAHLTLETGEGEGTSFIIRFPRHDKRVRVLPVPKDDL